jgi:hypothetical protein
MTLPTTLLEGWLGSPRQALARQDYRDRFGARGCLPMVDCGTVLEIR